MPTPVDAARQGFRLDYPMIALHAASRSVPEQLASYASVCVYCQLDDHQERDEDDESEDSGLREMWIGVTEDACAWKHPTPLTTVSPFYDALSHCASLHPSRGGASADAHPLAGLASLASGADGIANGGSDELSANGRVRSNARFRPY